MKNTPLSFPTLHSLEPRLAQGGKMAFYVCWVFEGKKLPKNLDRRIRKTPSHFCYLSSGFCFPA
jgi:hypothetical protein